MGKHTPNGSSSPRIDVEALAARLADAARVATGFALLGFQRAQVQRRRLERHLRRSLSSRQT